MTFAVLLSYYFCLFQYWLINPLWSCPAARFWALYRRVPTNVGKPIFVVEFNTVNQTPLINQAVILDWGSVRHRINEIKPPWYGMCDVSHVSAIKSIYSKTVRGVCVIFFLTEREFCNYFSSLYFLRANKQNPEYFYLNIYFISPPK